MRQGSRLITMRHAIPHCPRDVRRLLDVFVAGVRKLLGPDLAGIYLHGSLAMGCFRRGTSDIDLLVVTRRAIRDASRLRLVRFLLEVSGRPSPIEVTFLSARNLRPWRYPTRFDLHFSKAFQITCNSPRTSRASGG
jgi:predicted nucleotidyltransferase